MYLKFLSLLNFKNFSQAEYDFSSRINCFAGNNGVGKTNLLDSIHYLSLCKSFFNPVDTQNIRHGEEMFVIQGRYIRDGDEEAIYCGVKRNAKKQFRRNRKDYKKLSDHIGLIPLVMISPGDSVLITGGSDERRKFMNGVISQYDRQYLEDVINYNHALTQRNVLLKDFAKKRYFDRDSLDIWTEQMTGPGKRIHESRRSFIEKMIPVFRRFHEHLSLGLEEVSLRYDAQLHDAGLEDLMEAAVEKDRILQYTTCGIHKDDLDLTLGEHSMKKSGSQGQQKTYLIALKLAQFAFIRDLSGFHPILLLDDIFDKLDKSRVEQIISLVSENNFGQIFITDTSSERLNTILKDTGREFKLFHL
ncbi:MAG: DNA replication and repair protein RecF [Marinilabiliales bacterium]|nr:MAG: DNA replication and repair protein RecF [Marinilabiliales bacterium]